VLAKFASAVLDVAAIFPAADPLMAAPVTVHYRDSKPGLHCDTQEFTITVMFRPSEPRWRVSVRSCRWARRAE
jgi:hypothetical protein